MAWKCPNCETINQGEKCIVCGASAPGRKKSPLLKKKPSAPILIGAVAAGAILIAIIVALLVRQSQSTDDSETTDNSTDRIFESETATETETEPDTEKETETDKVTEEITETTYDETTAKEEETTVTDSDTGIISVSLDHTSVSLDAGANIKLVGSIKHKGTVDLTVKWTSSDSKICSVSTDGMVVALSAGKCTITMTASNGMTASCTVTVSAVEVSELKFSESEFKMAKGGSKKLTVYVTPSNASYGEFTWTSSDSSVVSVSGNGKTATVKGENIGKSVITVTSSNGVKVSCTVEVEASVVEVTSVKLNRQVAEMEVGDTITLSATVSPSDATDKGITYFSSNEKVATVDENGVVTAISEGLTTIRAESANGKYAECTVEVRTAEVTGVSVSSSKLTLEVGESWKLTAEVTPAGAENYNMTWSSSDSSIVAVSGDGNIEAKKIGTAVITCTVKTDKAIFTSECNVTVESGIISVEKCSLDATTLSMTKSESYYLTLSVIPVDAPYSVKWTSSDESIATVDGNGCVKAHAAGKATIRAEISENVYALCEVTVSDASSSTPVEYFVTTETDGGIIVQSFIGKDTVVIIPSSIGGKNVVKIGSNAFASKSVTSVTVPDTVTEIGESAFEGCTSLTEINLPSTLTKIGARAFYGSGIKSFTVGENVIGIGEGALANCKSLSAINVSEKNTVFKSENGALYTFDMTVLISVPAGNTSYVDYVTEDTLTSISAYAFCGNTSLKTAVIGENVIQVGDYAFKDCTSLANVEFKSDTTVKGDGLFDGCTGMGE